MKLKEKILWQTIIRGLKMIIAAIEVYLKPETT
jgi:hypothetical protein